MSEETKFPKSIKGFGYNFNEKGELRNIETDERFLFFVKPEDRSYNQRHYEELGEVIGEFIEDELVNKYNLIRKIIPVGLEENEESDDIAKSRIYLSDDAQECRTLLLLIQGSGVVRPGQWARQVIINDSLELGTMFPYIKKAQDLKWGIVIFNPNENYGCIMKDGKVGYRQIPGSESPLRHCLYVWDKFVKDARAEKIVIVAHSYGGICTTYMLDRFAEDFKLRVKGIALTDSVHSSGMIPSHSKKWFEKNALNWIKSSLPLSEPVYEANQYYGCKCVSAGHPKHEYTSGHAFEAVFEYLEFRLKEKRKAVTNQENEIGEQSFITNNKDTTAEIGSIKTQTQDGNSITHEKDTTTTEEGSGLAMEIGDETNAAIEEPQTTINKTNEISSENDITVIKEPQLDPMEIVEPDSNSAMEIGDEYNMTIEESQIDSNSVSKATDTTAIEEPQTDSMEIVIEGRQTDSNSAMEIADEIPKTSINEGSQPDSNSAMNELPNTDTEKPQIDSDSTMEIVNELPKTATKKQTNETSSEKDTKKDAEKPQLDPMKTTEKDTVAKNNISENEVVMINNISKETDSTTNVQAFKDDNPSEQHRSNETS